MALWPLSRSIGAKIFGAFVAMGLITGALGFYGLYVLAAAGGIVVDTYDRPLMAINFARSASLTFMQMDKEVLRRRIVVPAQQAGIDRRIEELTTSFFEDLVVADNRSLAADERGVIEQIRQLVLQWNRRRIAYDEVTDGELDDLAEKIIER